jgi:hypothetical protein
MIHREALVQRGEPDPNDPNPDCAGELLFSHHAPGEDVTWDVYICGTCGTRINTVGGAPHPWNHAGEASPIVVG